MSVPHGRHVGALHGAPRRSPPAPGVLVLMVAILLLRALAVTVPARASDPHASSTPEPVVRVAIDARQPVLVGQQVRMDVVVLVPNFFTAAPQFPELGAPGASVALLDDAVNANDTIGEVGYAGVQRTYVVTPQVPGEVRLPAARITFSYAAEPGKPGVAGSAEIPAQVIRAQRAGDGAARTAADTSTATGTTGDRATLVPVARVTIEQSLDRGLDGLKVGDAMTRTITTSARNAAAMTIPVPTFTAPDGVRLYGHDPLLTDVGERDGGPAGRRVDRVTYAFERAGRYTLPAIEVAWLDPRDQQRKSSRVPEITVTVAANPAAAPAIAPRPAAASEGDVGRADDTSRLLRPGLAWLGAAIVLAIAAISARHRWAHVVRARVDARRAARAAAEPAAFAVLDRACRANEPDAAYRALATWAPRAGFTSLASACAGRPDLATQVAALEARLYDRRGATGARAAWHGRALRDAVSHARPASGARARPSRRHAVPLAALNP